MRVIKTTLYLNNAHLQHIYVPNVLQFYGIAQGLLYTVVWVN